jgi:Dockerin type I domain
VFGRSITVPTSTPVLANELPSVKSSLFSCRRGLAVIKNRSGSGVIGTFSQGSTYTSDGYIFGINYAGGAGHDVVLTLRQLDVVPGDVNDDGVVVNSQDLVVIGNHWLGLNGTKPTIFGDINGDGVVNGSDYNDVRMELGTALPPVGGDPPALGGDLVVTGGARAGTPPVVLINPNLTKTSRRPAPHHRAEVQLARRGRGWSLGDGTRAKRLNPLKMEQT